MYMAIDKDKNREPIEEALKENKYYCEVCNSEVIVKRGNIKREHFAHKNLTVCDSFSRDMSDWHYNWQLQFPKESREVVLNNGVEKHRADVLIDGKVIEFQHSAISYTEFKKRNEFYTSLNYKVIWIFDTIKYFETDKIIEKENRSKMFKWKNPMEPLTTYDNKMKNVEIYLQGTPAFWELDEDPQEEAWLYHVTWATPNGFSHFAYDEIISDYDFLCDFNIIKRKEEEQTQPNEFDKKDLRNINDTFNSYGGNYYIYCPYYMKYENNKECMFCNHMDSNKFKCRYSFLKIPLDSNYTIDYIIRDKEDRITELNLINSENNIQKIKYEILPESALTLIELFELHENTGVIRARNIENDYNYQLTKFSYIRYKEGGKCFGKYCRPGGNVYEYSKIETEIYNVDKKIWLLEWYRKDNK